MTTTYPTPIDPRPGPLLRIAATATLLFAGTAVLAQADGSSPNQPLEPAAAEAKNESFNLTPVVVTAAGFEQKLTDAPASISIVTREDLQQRPYLTLIDAVRDLEGVDVGETSDKTGQKTISIRGMGSDYTLILINGRRQNNHGDIYPNAFGGNQFNHIPPLDTIERIEVIRGPASTLYGADALGGVINIITRPVADTWGGSATFGRSYQEDDSFGDDLTLDFNASGPLIANRLGLAVRGSIYERLASVPEYERVFAPDGTAFQRPLTFGGGGKTVDNTNQSLGGTLSWSVSDRQRVTFDYDISEQVYDNTPTNSDGVTLFPLGTVDSIDTIFVAANYCDIGGATNTCVSRGGTVLRRAAPRVGYVADQEFTRDQWSLTHQGNWDFGNSFVSLAYINTANNGRTLPLTVEERDLLLTMIDGTGEFSELTVDQRRALAEATFLPRPKRVMESRQYTFDAKLDIPVHDLFGNHHIVVGGQIIDGELEDGVFGLETGGDGDGTVQKQESYALFVEENWTPIDPLTVTLGVRFDDNRVFGDHTSPRLYGVYKFSENWLAKGGVSTGYKTPKTTDLYDGVTGFGGQGVSPFIGNPDLKPETSVNSEIALYWTSDTGDHNANITYFQNDFEDKIASGEVTQSCAQTGGVRPCANLGAFEQQGFLTYSQNINIDKVEIRGFEVAGRYRLIEPLSLRANYTYTDSEQKSGQFAGFPLNRTAKHMANATLDWAVTSQFNTQLTLESRSDRFRGTSAAELDEDGNPRSFKAYEVLHLSGRYRANEHVTLAARINNLLDTDFTRFQTTFIENDDGSFTPVYLSDYNNIDKARNFWVSVNVTF